MFCFEGIRTDKEGGDRAIERTHMCVRERDCVGGVRERERVREGGESAAQRMLTGNVWLSRELRVRPAGAQLTGSSK